MYFILVEINNGVQIVKNNLVNPELQYDKVSTYFQENKRLVIILSITDFLFNALMCLIPVVQGIAVNAFARGAVFSELCMLTGGFLSLVIFVQVNRLVKRYLGRSFGNKIALSMRKVSYENLLQTPMSEFQNISKGDLLNKMLSDITDASDGITMMTTETFDTIVLLLGYSITMFCMDVQIALIVMVFIIVSIVSAKAFKKLIYGYTKEYKEYLSYTKDLTLTCINNELNYRGFGVNETYRRRYEESQKILEKKSLKSMVLQSCLEPIYSMLTWFGLFFIVWIGGERVLHHTLDIGTFSAFLTTYMLTAAKASRVGRVYGWYQNLRVAWVRCKPYFKKKEDVRGVVERLPQKFVMKAQDFSFGFDEQFQLPVMDFQVKSGEMIGVCGKVHTGKSTLLTALSGLYPYEGSLKLEDYELSETKCPIGYCSSANLVFEDSIFYNVTMGRSEADDSRLTALEQVKTDEKFVKALSDAEFLQEVEAMPDKENQMLSHGLINLSGGQQKRLMLARALYGEPSLILLDDPFQSVDRKNVEKIMGNLKSYQNSIIFAVSNQDFVLEQMDKVLLLKEDGYEFGTWQEVSQSEPKETEAVS